MVVSKGYLAAWLLERGYGEEESGYGHATAEEIADALSEEFDVEKKEWS